MFRYCESGSVLSAFWFGVGLLVEVNFEKECAVACHAQGRESIVRGLFR